MNKAVEQSRDLEVGNHLDSTEYRSKNKWGRSRHKESDKWYFTVSYYIVVVIRVNVCYNKVS